MNFGPYHYAKPADIFEKKFGDRSFTVVLSNAYNAGGIIGSEYNGIAILDDNNRLVVLDRQHADRGMMSGDVRAEFEAIKSMDWSEFTAYCRKSPRYRSGITDIDKGTEPMEVDLLDLAISKNKVENPVGPDIRTPAMITAQEDTDGAYSYPARTREEMIVELANHKSYWPMNRNNGGFVLSWDIKVRGIPSASKAEGYNFDSQFDEKWAEYEQSSEDLFWRACADALYPMTSGEYSCHANEDIKAEFAANGRQGGHLILSKWNGPQPKGFANCNMAFDNREDFIDWLKELETDDLVSLYTLVRSVDTDTSKPEYYVSCVMAEIRFEKENEWREELGLATASL